MNYRRGQKKTIGKNFNKEILEQKLTKGIQELDEKKGTNFLLFLNFTKINSFLCRLYPCFMVLL